MISSTMVYDCLDNRKGADPSVSGFTMLQPIPDGFEVWHAMGRGLKVIFDDDDEAVQLEDKNGIVTIHTEEGSLDFVPLTLPDYERFGAAKKFGKTFKSTEELQDYYRRVIETQG